MAKKPKTPDPVILPDLAVVSFGDMMTLMLTFFILLFSMSETRRERIVATLNNFRLGQGIMPYQKSPVETFMRPQRMTQRQAQKLRNGQKGTRPEQTSNTPPPQHFTVVLGGDAVFERDGTQLTDRARQQLQAALPQFEGYRNIIEIRGHTAASADETSDPWRFGFERARNTMQFILDQSPRMDPRRFRLVSFGDTQPLDPRTPAANRRVELVMTDQMVRDPYE